MSSIIRDIPLDINIINEIGYYVKINRNRKKVIDEFKKHINIFNKERILTSIHHINYFNSLNIVSKKYNVKMPNYVFRKKYDIFINDTFIILINKHNNEYNNIYNKELVKVWNFKINLTPYYRI